MLTVVAGCLLGRLLPRFILSRPPFSLAWVDLHFRKTPHGRPYLFTPSLPFFTFDFNVSHDNEWVVCVAHSSQPSVPVPQLGVDVIKLALPWPGSTVTDLFETMQELMTPAEVSAHSALPSADQLEHLLRLWTVKEAIAKAQGLGLAADLASFDMSLSGPAQHSPTSSAKEYKIREVRLDDHTVAIASTTQIEDLKIVRLTADELIVQVSATPLFRT